LVTSRTALITLILLAPTAVRTTANSVFSSAGATPAAAPPPPAIMTGAAAAAETPRRSSSFFTSCAASSSDNPTIDSSNCCRSAMLFLHFVISFFDFVIPGSGFQCDQVQFPCARQRSERTAQPPTCRTTKSLRTLVNYASLNFFCCTPWSTTTARL